MHEEWDIETKMMEHHGEMMGNMMESEPLTWSEELEELEKVILEELRSSLPLAERLMRAERALLGRLGASCSRELPLSVVELVYLRQGLRQELDGLRVAEEAAEELAEVAEEEKEQVVVAVDVERLVQHTADLVKELSEENVVRPWLLRCLELEERLCEAHGVRRFADFGLQSDFRTFVASNEKALGARLPKTGLQVAKRLKILGKEALEEHFLGLDVPMEELESSEEVARELQVLLARSGWAPLRPPSLDLSGAELAKEALRRITEAPVMVDLLEVVPWASGPHLVAFRWPGRSV